MGDSALEFEGYRLDKRARVLYAPSGRSLALTGKAINEEEYNGDHGSQYPRNPAHPG